MLFERNAHVCLKQAVCIETETALLAILRLPSLLRARDKFAVGAVQGECLGCIARKRLYNDCRGIALLTGLFNLVNIGHTCQYTHTFPVTTWYRLPSMSICPHKASCFASIETACTGHLACRPAVCTVTHNMEP